MVGSRIFVAFVFTILAASFYVSTYMLIHEFGVENWYSIAAIYSHHFLFFPTIGVVALIAFYTPATIFVDLYWHHVNHGRLRLFFGFTAILCLAIYLAAILSGRNVVGNLLWQNDAPVFAQGVVPAIWELHPDNVLNDLGSPENCATNDLLCARQPIMRSIKILRKVSMSRTGLTAFSRNCLADPLLEPPQSNRLLRYCFPLLRKVDAETCCFAQQRFSSQLSELFKDEKQHSKTGYVDARTLPFKIFFMLIILVIGVLLAGWRSKLDRFYESYMPGIENGVLIGGAAMLFWPVTNQAFLQSAAALYGPYSGSVYQNVLGPVFSIVFGLWGLLILFFFFRHHEKHVELWVK
ncbi:MAG: hypothetical protein L3J67_13800, partial [Hyphomicrobiaceae bacterium]|nr:hypothetical protein [Hyphomicrobiaceae bacterium]